MASYNLPLECTQLNTYRVIYNCQVSEYPRSTIKSAHFREHPQPQSVTKHVVATGGASPQISAKARLGVSIKDERRPARVLLEQNWCWDAVTAREKARLLLHVVIHSGALKLNYLRVNESVETDFGGWF